MAPITVDEAVGLVERLEALATDPSAEILQNDALRRKLREAGKNMSFAMEIHGDTIYRIAYSVRFGHFLECQSSDSYLIGLASGHGSRRK
jgi:hypothetical protein